MKILTNARHWKQNAFGLVEITYNPEKDLLRAKLELITKLRSHAVAMSKYGDYIVVPTTATCSTPEQIIDNAVRIWKTERAAEEERKRNFEEREKRMRELLESDE